MSVLRNFFACRFTNDDVVKKFDSFNDALDFARTNSNVAYIQFWQTDGRNPICLGKIWKR